MTAQPDSFIAAVFASPVPPARGTGNALSPFGTYYVVIADYSHLSNQRAGDTHGIPGDLTTSLERAHDQYLEALRDSFEYEVTAPRVYAWNPDLDRSAEVTATFREALAEHVDSIEQAAADLAEQSERDQIEDLRFRNWREDVAAE